MKERLLVEKPALEANLRNILRLVPGDRREAEAAVADAEVKLDADVAAAEDADAKGLTRVAIKQGHNFMDTAKVFKGASKCTKGFGFSKICAQNIPACFVGDIQIVMAGRLDDPAATPITAAPIDAAGPNWLYSTIVLGLGVGTHAGLDRRKRRLEQHERDALIDALFNSDEDLDGPNLDDDLYTTLASQTKVFARNNFPALNQPPSPGVATPGLGAMPTLAVGMSSRASTPTAPCTVLDRPATRRTIEHSPRLRRGAAIERDPLAQRPTGKAGGYGIP